MAPGSALAQLADKASGCTRCALAGGRTQVVFGVGDPSADLMFVGEAPGRDEDLAGEPFVGRSGKLLDRLLHEELGVDRRRCYIANVVKCRPPDNRDPRPEEITSCRPYLDQQLELIDPTVVVTLGNFATKLLLATDLGITKVRGQAYPLGGRHLVPTYHPAAALRSGGVLLAEMRADLVRAKQLLGWGRVNRPGPVAIETGNAAETRSVAAAVAPLCVPGDVVLLAGDLGAGKTTFAQGFGAGLGITEQMTSPTFTLVRQYAVESSTPVSVLLHADVYRLDHLQEIVDLGLGELVDDAGVALVEWGDRAEPVLGRGSLAVELALVDEDDDHRRLSFRSLGDAWSSRWDALEAALSPWVVAA